MLRSLVGSEMCIRDRPRGPCKVPISHEGHKFASTVYTPLYTLQSTTVPPPFIHHSPPAVTTTNNHAPSLLMKVSEPKYCFLCEINVTSEISLLEFSSTTVPPPWPAIVPMSILFLPWLFVLIGTNNRDKKMGFTGLHTSVGLHSV